MSTPSLDVQREYYDRRWTGATYANLQQLEKAIAVLEGLHTIGIRNPRILDLGCGNGWLSGILSRFGSTTGVDLSAVAIQHARACHPDVTFMAGDLFNVKPESLPFDVVVTVEVIQHVEDQHRFLDLVARWLGPGGHLILLTTNAWNLRQWPDEEIIQFTGGLQPIEQWLTTKQLKALLTPLFKVKQLRTILPGRGHSGVLRLAHSVKLSRVLSSIGLLDFYRELLLRLGFGLLLFTVAERR